MNSMPLQSFGNYMARNPKAMNEPVSNSPQPNMVNIPDQATKAIQPGVLPQVQIGKPAPQANLPERIA